MANWIAGDSGLGWAAGCVDGEGCISIYGRAGKHHKGLQLVVSVVNTDPRMPRRMQEMLGGWFGRSSGAVRGRRKPTFVWIVTGKPAGLVLEKLRPYLVIKGEQADIAIAYCQTIGTGGPRSPKMLEKRQELRAELKLMRSGGAIG